MSSTDRLPFVACASVLIFLAMLVADHVLAPQLNPLHYTISEYANVDGFPGVAGVATLAAWAASFLLVAALSVRVGRSWLLVASLIVAGCGLLVAAMYATQAVRGIVPSGTPVMTSGRLHDVGGGIGQLAIFVAALVSLWRFSDARFRVLTVLVLLIGLMLGPGVAALDGRVRGIRQRTLVVVAASWQLALIGQLRRAPSRPGSTPVDAASGRPAG